MACWDANEASGLLLSLGGLVGHAAFKGALGPRAARRVLLQIRDLTSNPAVTAFAGQAARQLDELIDGGGAGRAAPEARAERELDPRARARYQ